MQKNPQKALDLLTFYKRNILLKTFTLSNDQFWIAERRANGTDQYLVYFMQ